MEEVEGRSSILLGVTSGARCQRSHGVVRLSAFAYIVDSGYRDVDPTGLAQVGKVTKSAL